MPSYLLAVDMFGQVYGWTERQTMEETSEAAFDWLPKIIRARHEAAEMERKQEERMNRKTGKG